MLRVISTSSWASVAMASSAASIASAVRLAALSMQRVDDRDRDRRPPASPRARPNSRCCEKRADEAAASRRGAASRRLRRRACRAPASAVAARSTSSWVASPRENSAVLQPLAQHDDPVAHADELGHLRGDQDDRHALRRKVGDHGVDLGLRLHVDALRRLVEDQERRRGRAAISPAPPSAGCRRTAPRPAGRSSGSAASGARAPARPARSPCAGWRSRRWSSRRGRSAPRCRRSRNPSPGSGPSRSSET